MKDKKILRGDMFYANLGKGIGSEQKGYRPVLVIQNDVGNKFGPTVIVASITSRVGIKAKLPTHYFINTEDGLQAPSIILLEQIRTIDKKRLDSYIGHLSQKNIDGVNEALHLYLSQRNKRIFRISAYYKNLFD